MTHKARVVALVLAIPLVLFGWLMFSTGRQMLGLWHSISASLAAFAIIAVLTGLIMLVTGLWIFGSRGGARIPLRLGGVATLVAGTALIVGVLTYVVPCGGPS